MSETKFTKGEWVVADGAYPSIIEVRIPNRMPITMVLHATDIDYIDSMEITANAHLIAAAPEMYEMLNSMIEQFEYDGCTEYEFKLLASAKALLPKARGESC